MVEQGINLGPEGQLPAPELGDNGVQPIVGQEGAVNPVEVGDAPQLPKSPVEQRMGPKGVRLADPEGYFSPGKQYPNGSYENGKFVGNRSELK